MPSWVSAAAFLLALVQASSPQQRATVSPQSFVGTWVGTQAWAIANPPPGSRPDQPVAITIEVVDGKIQGTMIPFLGGQDGARFLDGKIVGDELQAAAVVGGRRQAAASSPAAAAQVAPSDEESVPSTASGKGKGRGAQPTWKDSVKVQFIFKNDGLDLKGTADLMMNDVKWVTFSYDLSKKRSRY